MYWSLAVPNPRISADQPSLARGVARPSDRKLRCEALTEYGEAGHVCLLDD